MVATGVSRKPRHFPFWPPCETAVTAEYQQRLPWGSRSRGNILATCFHLSDTVRSWKAMWTKPLCCGTVTPLHSQVSCRVIHYHPCLAPERKYSGCRDISRVNVAEIYRGFHKRVLQAYGATTQGAKLSTIMEHARKELALKTRSPCKEKFKDVKAQRDRSPFAHVNKHSKTPALQIPFTNPQPGCP